ncbi:amidohydrolase family protein [Sphingosinicella sp.]|uniref:amidohydrolase family protein n=1 Tax=Sphingosinicella sp. TaxID=1917971 RepID=UPI00184F5A8F|nr:amidohydrolase family protein [Sphingosinicella sp.]MBA4759617.1 amidohydrolase family protein [Sphingosinicella sp.]
MKTRHKLVTWLASAAVLVIIFGSATAIAAEEAVVPVVDHHLHPQGPAISALLKRVMAASPEMFKDIAPEIVNERSGVDTLRILDEGGIKGGILLSAAYMLASPLIGEQGSDIAELTRAENRYVVDMALKSHGRLKAFISVNPMHSDALSELEYWRGREGVSGVKLHLANSGYDQNSEAHTKALATIIDRAREGNLALVIHVSSPETYSRQDTQLFIRNVLSHAGDEPVQVVHCGGSGYIDQRLVDTLDAYREAIEARMPGTRNLVFDLALLVSKPDTEGTPDALVATMRRIGLDRFVAGSDWPGMGPPKSYFTEIKGALPLSSAEWNLVFLNVAPFK